MRVVPALVLLLLAVPPGAEGVQWSAGAPWPSGRGDARNTGGLRGWVAQSVPPGVAPWRFPTAGPVSAAPVIDGAERLYAGTVDGWVHAFDPVRGREVWRVPVGGPVSEPPALGSDGALYVSGGAVLAALSVDGASRWVRDRRSGGAPPLPGMRQRWQGGVTVGASGAPCAGADDFLFLCLEPSGAVRWARRLGLPVWGTAAADDEGALYVPALDMRVYALEPSGGAVRWRTDVGAPVATALVVGGDRTVYAGAVDGRVHALDGGSGAVRWSTSVGGPILGSSPALSDDGVLYVATTEGVLAALDAQSGRRRWILRFASPFRSSPAVGPDPEGRAHHLVYLGGGDGRLHALDPEGRTRWVYDTAGDETGLRPVGLDGGPALGQWGVAVGSATGVVHYVPYDYYLQPDAMAIRRPADGEEWSSPGWRITLPAGTVSAASLAASDTAAEAVSVGRADLVTLRAGPVDATTGRGPALADEALEVRGVRGTHRVVRFGDRRTIGLVPRSILPPGARVPVGLTARERAGEGDEVVYEGRVVLQAAPESVDNPIALRLHRGFRVERPWVTHPPTMAALVQTALAASTMRLAVIDILPVRRTFVAWGVQESPAHADGPGSAQTARALVFAFAGRWHGDAVVLETTDAFVDLSGITVAVDRLRLAGRFLPGGRLAPGATLLAEVRPAGVFAVLDALTVDGARIGPPATWVGAAWARASVLETVPALWRILPSVARFVSRRPWEALGVANGDGEVVCSGTFEMTALSAREMAAPPVRVRSLGPDAGTRRVVAEVLVESSGRAARRPVLSLLLVDPRTGAPVALDYNRAVRREQLPGGVVRLEMPLPAARAAGPGALRVHVMADLASIASTTVE